MHKFVDTNIFLRFLTNDVPKQAEKCAILIQKLKKGQETVEISVLAAAEIVWTLERFYKLSKSDIASKMTSILKLRGTNSLTLCGYDPNTGNSKAALPIEPPEQFRKL